MKGRTAFIGLALLVAGCGGGVAGAPRDTDAKGAARLTILWPERQSRYIPASADSVRVGLYQGGALVGSDHVVARPTDGTTSTTTEFENLRYGDYNVRIAAYPTTNGTGTAQAMGEGTLHVSHGSDEQITVSLKSQIQSLVLSSASGLLPGVSGTVTATAYDGDGFMVLLASDTGGHETLTWDVDDKRIATVQGTSPTVTVKGLYPGATKVRATLTVGDAGDRKDLTAAADVTVDFDGKGTVIIR